MADADAVKAAAPVPRSFLDYLRAMGPGLVVVLTWLGAGDIVDSAVAGGSYGYALMWVMVLALSIRWLFVSTIAKYQLCNPRGESLLEGFKRLHGAFPPFILCAAILFSHIVNAYMYQGLGDSLSAIFGGWPAAWAFGFALLCFALVQRPVFRRIEVVFLLFLGLLSVSLLGNALWVGPDPGGILRGVFGFELPAQRGSFDPKLVAVSLIGAVAGSLANLMYPYFIREKGWNGPEYRKVQLYDLALGVVVVVVLDLAVWSLGAEILHPRGLKVENIHDIAGILGHTLGQAGRIMLYLGVFAAVGSSIVGNALAYGYMATDAYLLWRPDPAQTDYRAHPGYRWVTVWALFSPLVWMFGKTSFVAFTVAVNAFQVLLLPILAAAVWVLTAHPRFIGEKYRNRWWENLGMAFFLAMALLGAAGSAQSLLSSLK